ncbi:MAG TPA: hypothetical protein VE907_10520 [Gammaproteobacteria bacterium]|nr:hypothetical protein [Gammaproteobacteria bacterium]
MFKNLALLASLCANLALLGLALLGADTTAASAPAAVAGARAAPDARRRDSDDAATYYRGLKTLGLDEHEARLLVGARVEERAMAGLRAPPDRYWEPGQSELANYGVEVAGAQAAVRNELHAALGASAERAPELARVFRPLSPRFEFLSAQEQVALQGWRLRRHVDSAPAERGGRAAPPAAVDLGGDELAQLREVLPAAAAFEVAVRESALAEQLRTSGAKFSETEFRETYTLLTNRSGGRGIDAQLAQRRRLQSLLGAARFDRVWAIRDPLAAVVRDASRGRGLDDADTLRAYGVLNANQERLTELAASGDLKSERTAAAAQAIARDEQTELARAVGEENARAILNARSAYFIALSRAAPQPAPAPSE